MKRFLLALFLLLFLFIGTHAQTNHIVISQIYGAGGNSGALFKHDFVELYNPTAAAVNITGWSLQYTSAMGSNWGANKVDLNGSIEPGKYFLIQLSGSSNGNDLPAPDLSSTNISMSTTAGKLVLVNNATALTGNCPSSASIVDRLGYGTNADCSETANAPGTTILLAIYRGDNGCTDNDNNSSDFSQAAPGPRNSSSPANVCNGSGITITAITNHPFCVDGTNGANAVLQYNARGNFSNANFIVQLSDVNGGFTSASTVGSATVTGANPSGSVNITIPAMTSSGTNYRLRILADNPSLTGNQTAALEVINGAKNVSGFAAYTGATKVTLNWTNPDGCFDEMMIIAKEGSTVTGTPAGDGSSYAADLSFTGNGTAFGGGKIVYKGSAGGQTVTGLVIGTSYYFKIFTRRGTQWSAGVEINELTRHVPQQGEIVINQFSPGFQDASDEYVELVNTTDKAFDLADVSFGYQSSTGVGSINEALVGTMKPHSYWLLSAKGAITVGKTNSLSRDDQINGNFSQLGGQIAILRKADGAVIDAVAYGNVTAGNYIEGSPAANAPAGGGLKRITDGVDNNTNNLDFGLVANVDIDLRNSSSILANEGAQIAAGTYSRIYVTGNTSLSGNVILSEKLVLVHGILSLDNYNLTSEEAVGGTADSYVKTNATGSLIMNNISSDPKTFPVGNGTWNPLVITNGGGLNWSVRMEDAVQGVSSNKLVQRTWHITPSAQPASGATLLFEYNDGDAAQISSGFNKNEDIQVWNFHDSKWQSAGLVSTPTGTAGGKRTVTLSNWMQFSPFALANMTGPLPIHFYGEKASVKKSSVEIAWLNLTEENVRHYEIERSEDGVNFLKIGVVLAYENKGASAEYNFTDAVPGTGKIYYRIKAVEEDGAVTYSRIIAARVNDMAASFSIHPNPIIKGVLNYSIDHLPQGKYAIRIYNVAGQAIYQGSIHHRGGSVSETITLPASKSGLYYLLVSGPVSTQKQFMIE